MALTRHEGLSQPDLIHIADLTINLLAFSLATAACTTGSDAQALGSSGIVSFCDRRYGGPRVGPSIGFGSNDGTPPLGTAGGKIGDIPGISNERPSVGNVCRNMSGLWTLHAMRVYTSTFGARVAAMAMAVNGMRHNSLKQV